MTTEEKAAKYDELVVAIDKVYFTEDGEERAEDDEEGGDLLTIGEIAATKLGYM